MSDRRFFCSVLILTMFIAAWPYASGRVIAPSGALFYGNQSLAPSDFSVYYSYIIQGRQGHLFMYDAFTSESHQATLIQPVWFVVGQISRLGGLDASTMFALTRLALAPLLLWVLWWAARWLWPQDKLRQRTGLIMSIISSGFGGALAVFFHVSMWRLPDIWVSEAFTMLTLWSSPHFILVTAGIVFFLVSIERSWIEQTWRRARWAGLVAGLVAFIHPFHVLTWCVMAALLVTWHWWQSRKFPSGYILRWLFIGACVTPALLLYGLQLLYDPVTIGRAIQNINLTRSLAFFALGLGFPLLFIAVTLCRKKWRQEYRNTQMQWAAIVAIAYSIAIYLPVAFQRRLSQGIIIFFAWLTVPLISRVIQRILVKPKSTAVMILVLGGMCISSTWLVDAGVIFTDHVNDLRVSNNMYYVSAEYQHLARYLRTTNPHQPTLTTILEGNVLAGLSAHQMFVGYSVETLNSKYKNEAMSRFFRDMSQTEQRQLLQHEQLCYVLDSPRTRLYGSAFVSAGWPDFTAVWRGPTMTLYKTSYCRT